MYIFKPKTKEEYYQAVNSALSIKHYNDVELFCEWETKSNLFNEINEKTKAKELPCFSLCIAPFEKLTKGNKLNLPNKFEKVAPLIKGKALLIYTNFKVPSFERLYNNKLNECKN